MSEQSSLTAAGPHVDAASSLPVLMKAVWLVMKKRDAQNYRRILEFLELTHEQVPGLLCFMHHAKLNIGLRGKIVLHMIEEKKPLLNILTELNFHFPPVFSYDSAAAQRNLFKVQQCKIHFRKLVLRMIRDERFRKNYVQNMLHLEYGENYMAVLEKLLWEFLCRLQAALNHQVPQTLEPPVVDEDQLSSTPVHHSSGLNFSVIPGVNNTIEMSKAKKKTANPTTEVATFIDGPEESPSGMQSLYEEQQTQIKNKQAYGQCDGTGQRTSQGVGRKKLNLFIPPLDDGNRMDESQPPYFEIFGFDCSENSKVNREELSPPDAFQSQGLDFDPEHVSDPHSRRLDVTAHKSFTDVEAIDLTQTLNHFPVTNGEPKAVHDVPRGTYKRQGKGLTQRLMKRRYQPRVQLAKLPQDIINKYVGQQLVQDGTPQVADSEFAQREALPHSGSWSWVCSNSTDNDSNDPDYSPGSSYILDDDNDEDQKRVLHLTSW
ncbi:hypothetical protein PRIEUP_LOCUS5858, partial [Pristimantis euphronides]